MTKATYRLSQIANRNSRVRDKRFAICLPWYTRRSGFHVQFLRHRAIHALCAVLVLVAVLFVAIYPLSTWAANNTPANTGGGVRKFIPGCEPPASNYSGDTSTLFGQCVKGIYLFALAISGSLAMLMIVLGGYMYVTAAGNAQQAAKGKEFIVGAVTGLVILFTAVLLLRTINPQLLDLKFKTPVISNGNK